MLKVRGLRSRKGGGVRVALAEIENPEYRSRGGLTRGLAAGVCQLMC